MAVTVWRFPGIYKADAQKVADEISAIDGEITPEKIVEAARDEASELHKCFEWDNDKAAECWRKHQAVRVMHFLVIRETEEDTETVPIRVFYKNDRSEGYKPSATIFRVDDEYQKLLQTAMAELRAFKRKYARLQELSEILELID